MVLIANNDYMREDHSWSSLSFSVEITMIWVIGALVAVVIFWLVYNLSYDLQLQSEDEERKRKWLDENTEGWDEDDEEK